MNGAGVYGRKSKSAADCETDCLTGMPSVCQGDGLGALLYVHPDNYETVFRRILFLGVAKFFK